MGFFDYQFAPRYKGIHDKMGTLYGFKHPSQWQKLTFRGFSQNTLLGRLMSPRVPTGHHA
jgi:hypothetical protein